mmetsp:Transcript_66528/g.187384  ORF Transcript_66528/g.187384 Transcript_66528/m.187384 type:complete len:274 (+) Transcript_66528:168-989(+)
MMSRAKFLPDSMSMRYSRPPGQTAFRGTSRQSRVGSNQTRPPDSWSLAATAASRSKRSCRRWSRTLSRHLSAVAAPKMRPYSNRIWCQCSQACSSCRRTAFGASQAMPRSHSQRSSTAACRYSSRLPQTWPSLLRTLFRARSSAHRLLCSADSAASVTFPHWRTAAAMAAAFTRMGTAALPSACSRMATRLSPSMEPASASSASSCSVQRSRAAAQSKSSAKCRASRMRSMSTSAEPYRSRRSPISASLLRPSGIVTEWRAPDLPGHRSAAVK